jgi:hypothetical protein
MAANATAARDAGSATPWAGVERSEAQDAATGGQILEMPAPQLPRERRDLGNPREVRSLVRTHNRLVRERDAAVESELWADQFGPGRTAATLKQLLETKLPNLAALGGHCFGRYVYHK